MFFGYKARPFFLSLSSLAFVFPFFFSPAHAHISTAPDTSLIFEAIARENLKTLTHLSTDTKISAGDNSKSSKKFHESLLDTLEEQLNLNTKEKRRLIFTLFAHYEKAHPFVHPTVLDKTSWQDLELVCGPKSNTSYYVASKIDRTLTEAGRAVFLKKFIEPTDNTTILLGNQAIIKELSTNPKLFKKLRTQLKHFAKTESAVLSLWQEDVFENILKQDTLVIPYGKKASTYINKSPHLVEVFAYTKLISFMTANALLVATAIALPAAGVATLTKHTKTEETLRYYIQKHGLETAAFFSASGLSFAALKYMHPNSTGIQGTSDLVVGPITGFPSLFFPEHIRYVITFRKCLQTKLMEVSKYISSLKSIAALAKECPALATYCPAIAQLDEELIELSKKSADLKQLLKLLETNTFKGRPSFFSWYGRANVAYQLLHKIKNDLVHPMMVVGELDTYMSCAVFMHECTQKNIPVCFATFSTANKPELTITDFWNPSIPGERAITNSLAIGTPGNPPNVIVTGPNAGGKSTTMKGLIVSVLLAQTFGIATAHELTFTPFSKIITYLNITDDIAAGKSHFKAGVVRAHELIETAESSHEKYNFTLTAVDEVFNGTTFYEGQAAAYALIDQLSTFPTNMCVTITHFPRVPLLEQEKPHLFANYKVSVCFGPDGQMAYPYKLEKGVSHQNIALEILKNEGFNGTFLDKATEILAQHNDH